MRILTVAGPLFVLAQQHPILGSFVLAAILLVFWFMVFWLIVYLCETMIFGI